MKNLTRKTLALVLCTILFCAMLPLTGLAEGALTDGYYFYQGDQTGGLPCFFRFNEDGSYYGKFFGGGMTEAGNYVVIDKEMEYALTADENSEKAIATQVIVLTNYATGTTQELAYANDTICDATLGGMSNHITLEHKADYVYVAEVEEMPIAVQTFYYENDTGSSLTLYHDRSFNDFTNAWDEGTWTLNDGVFTLTCEDGVFTLTISENGQTATYVKGDETLELSATTGSELYAYRATVMPAELPMDVDVALKCKADGSCELTVSHIAFGEVVVDQGTWEIANMVFITFNMDVCTYVLRPSQKMGVCQRKKS